jgi:hypothetical protein
MTAFILAAAMIAAPELPPGTPKLPPGFDVEKMSDPKEAAKAADWIEKEYGGKPTQAARMLVAVLRGMKADGSNGWFDPAESRYTWAWLAERNGLDAKAKAIPKDKFKGSAALFERLDRDGDGRITPADFDWSDRNPYVMQASMITRLFRRMDGNTDGELTPAELQEFFKRVGNGKDAISAEDLRNAMIPRGPAGFSPGDAPSTTVLLKGFFGSEIGSLQDGPAIGDAAPDFALEPVKGDAKISYSSLAGKQKPTVLILGNFTCGPFRALYTDLESIYKRNKADAGFLMVYVREAHPSDGWKMEQNERFGVSVKQPTSLIERTKVAGQFCTKLKPTMPVLVDDVDDKVGNLYSGMPGRLYVIDANGKVAYKSGRGPFGFKAGEMEQALVMALLESEK